MGVGEMMRSGEQMCHQLGHEMQNAIFPSREMK